MGNTNDLSSRINAKYKSMSRGQKLLTAYITDHYDKAAFLTAAKMGAAVGVSESTAVRYALLLGYKGYPEFQEALQEQVQGKLKDAHAARTVSGRASRSEILEMALALDRKNIKETSKQIDAAAFALAVDAILDAGNIYVIGVRNCAPLASFFASCLHLMFDRVHLLNANGSGELFEQLMWIDKGDVVVGISFPRYSMRTLKAMEFANNRSARVITLTDSVHSPMNLYSSCNLVAKSDMPAAWGSMTAPLSVVNALLLALYAKKQTEVADALECLEGIWGEYQVYGSDEMEPADDFIGMQYAKETGESH